MPAYELRFSSLDKWVLRKTVRPTTRNPRFARVRWAVNRWAFNFWLHLRVIVTLTMDFTALYRAALFDETLRCGVVGAYLNGTAPETHVRRQCEALNVPLQSPWHMGAEEYARNLVSGLDT